MTVETNRVERFFERLGRRLAPVLRLVSVLVVVFIVVEVLALAALTIAGAVRGEHGADEGSVTDPWRITDIYEEVDWAEAYFAEFEASHRTIYRPYTEYRRLPFSGEHINVDSAGLRRTVPDCGAGAGDPVAVFFMGGSAAWGSGARDEGTIPSHLAGMLCDRGIPATVTNYGESGYTNTQELVTLVLELRAGRVPDLVVFYDGVNDVYSSYQNGVPGLPQNVAGRMTPQDDGGDDGGPGRHPAIQRMINLVLLTNTGQVARTIRDGIRRSLNRGGSPSLQEEWSPPQGDDATRLDRRTVDTILENIQVIRSLEDEYGFQSLFYWQPAIYTKRVQSAAERNLPRDSVFGAMYLRVTELIEDQSTIQNLADVFGDDPQSVFVDEFHVSERANRLIADVILPDVLDRMDEATPLGEESVDGSG